MKKLICLFLMLWLPLFMGSASAMNMRMELQNQLPNAITSADMPINCHMDMAKKSSNSHSNQSHQKCASCGMCAIANASASFNTVPNFDLPAAHSNTPPLLQVAFISTDLPPAIKPPILN